MTDLPIQFEERVRPDIVKRAVLSIQSKNRKPEGTDPEAGNKHVTRWRQRRRVYRAKKGRGQARTPQKVMQGRGMQLFGEGAEAPNTRGGRPAHGPVSEKDYTEEINDKERRKAIRSGIAATADKELVQKHHNYEGELPLTHEGLEEIEKTKDLQKELEELGLEEELQRVKQKKVRKGRGAKRGRKYKTKVGPLVVVAEDNGVKQAAANIPGVNVETVENLNAQLLAPGAEPGRLTIWSTKALEKMNEEQLFQN